MRFISSQLKHKNAHWANFFEHILEKQLEGDTESSTADLLSKQLPITARHFTHIPLTGTGAPALDQASHALPGAPAGQGLDQNRSCQDTDWHSQGRPVLQAVA